MTRRRNLPRPLRGRAALVSALLLPAFAADAAASPWNRDPGQPLTISKSAYYEAEEDGRRFVQSTAETYLEWGVTDRVMLGGKLGYAWQRTEASAPGQASVRDSLSGFSEAELFVQGQLTRWDGGALALSATLAAPVKTTSRVFGDRAFERDGSLGAALHLGLDRDDTFAVIRVGPQVSTGDDAAFLRTEASLGRKLGARGAMVLLEGFGTTSLGGAEAEGIDFDLYQVAPSVVLPAWRRIRVQLGGSIDVAGAGVDLGVGAFIGFWVGE